MTKLQGGTSLCSPILSCLPCSLFTVCSQIVNHGGAETHSYY